MSEQKKWPLWTIQIRKFKKFNQKIEFDIEFEFYTDIYRFANWKINTKDSSQTCDHPQILLPPQPFDSPIGKYVRNYGMGLTISYLFHI